MTINQIFNNFSNLFKRSNSKNDTYNLINWKYFYYLITIIILFSIFLIISNFINQKYKAENQNLDLLVKSEEFLNLSEYFTSKITDSINRRCP